MPSALTNTAWAKICAAAGRRPNAESEARAMLSKVLFEDYPGFTYDRERVATAAERAERMLVHLAAFEADYRVLFPTDVWKTDRHYEIKRNIAIKTERGLRWIEGLRGRTEAELRVARTLKDANDRRQNVQRAMLYHWLCNVWLAHFEGPELPDVGLPRTPLVNFTLAAMRQVMPGGALPRPDTVRENIDRERRERARLRAQQLQWLGGDASFAPQNRFSKPACLRLLLASLLHRKEASQCLPAPASAAWRSASEASSASPALLTPFRRFAKTMRSARASTFR
jgi:hypothetical protein